MSSRVVICQDAIPWLENVYAEGLNASVFTSLPDISELSRMLERVPSNDKIRYYEKWFTDVVTLVLQKIPAGQCGIFLQSDVRIQDKDGLHVKWLDKSHLCAAGADRVPGCVLLWHKIALISNLEKKSAGRPTFSHLMCFGKDLHYRSGDFATPDVLQRGEMVWPKGIGMECCLVGVMFLKNVVKASRVVDPFCGHGTVLAVANAVGLDALGIEISRKRCRKARALNLYENIIALSPSQLKHFFGLSAAAQRVLVMKTTGPSPVEGELTSLAAGAVGFAQASAIAPQLHEGRGERTSLQRNEIIITDGMMAETEVEYTEGDSGSPPRRRSLDTSQQVLTSTFALSEVDPMVISFVNVDSLLMTGEAEFEGLKLHDDNDDVSPATSQEKTGNNGEPERCL